MAETIDEVASGGANAVIEHKGMVGKGHRGYGSDIGSYNTPLSKHITRTRPRP